MPNKHHVDQHAADPASMEDPPTPDLDELQQRPPTLVTVPVRVEGITPVRVTPSKAGPIQYDTVDTTPTQVLGADLGRTQAVICADAAIYISNRSSGTKGKWPASTPLYVGHADELWVSAVTGTAAVTTITEYAPS